MKYLLEIYLFLFGIIGVIFENLRIAFHHCRILWEILQFKEDVNDLTENRFMNRKQLRSAASALKMFSWWNRSRNNFFLAICSTFYGISSNMQTVQIIQVKKKMLKIPIWSAFAEFFFWSTAVVSSMWPICNTRLYLLVNAKCINLPARQFLFAVFGFFLFFFNSFLTKQ